MLQILRCAALISVIGLVNPLAYAEKINAYPDATHFVIDNDTVYDRKTKLTWMRCSVGQTWQRGAGCVGKVGKFTFEEAQQQGSGGWRVPTKDELPSLLDPALVNSVLKEPTLDVLVLDVKAFPNMDRTALTYWTSSLSAPYREGTGWGVSFYYAAHEGQVKNHFKLDNKMAVRLVRGNPYVFKGGLVSEDGEYVYKEDMARRVANLRYLIKGDSVLDKETNLTWMRCSIGQKLVKGTGCIGKAKEFNFEEALQQGRDGWRLPTKDELLTLVDKDRLKNMKVPTMDRVAFPVLDENEMWYWSGTLGGNSAAWYVGFNGGFFNGGITYRSGDRNSRFPVRLVRDGR